DLPQAYRVALGMVEQHRAVALGGVEITRQKGDRACSLAEDAAEGQSLLDDVPFLDVVLDHAQCLLGKSLQPEDASLEIMRRYPHIEPHADDLGLVGQGLKLRERAVDMIARLSLITEVMLGRREETIGHHQIDRIAGLFRQTGKA